MIPNKITISRPTAKDGELVTEDKVYYYIINHNTRNAFRAEMGLKWSEVDKLFAEFFKEPKKQNPDKLADAGENFGRFFFHGIKEGCRIANKAGLSVEFDLDLNDVMTYLSESGSEEALNAYIEQSIPVADEEDKKKVMATTE